MSDEVKTCNDCKHFIVDVGFRRGVCEIKKSRVDKWGQERTIRRMASCKACKRALPKQEPTDALFFIGTGQQVEDFAKQVRELETYKDEYRLAAAANKQLSEALDKAREENKMLRLQMFAFVRNSAVMPVGRSLNKSEQEITDKTFETIEAAKAMLDVEAVKELMNLASNKENRYDI